MFIQVTLLGGTSCLITIEQPQYSVFNRSLHKYRKSFVKWYIFTNGRFSQVLSPFRPMRTPFHALADSCHSCDHSEFPDGGRFCCAVLCCVSLLVQCICCIGKHFTAALSSGVKRAPRLRAWGFDKLNLLNRGEGLFVTSCVLISVL